MKKTTALLALLSFFLFVTAIPCFAEETLSIEKDVKDAKAVVEKEKLSDEMIKTEETKSADLPVDTAEEGKPEPNLPEVAASATYMGVVDMWVDMSFISMAALNKTLDTIAGTPGTSVTKLTTAYVIGVDADFFLFKGIPVALGPRLEYIGCFQGKITSGSNETTIDASLIPLMVGGNYEYKIPSVPVSLIGDLYAGYGLARAKFTESTGTSKEEYPSTGGTFVLDIGARINYEIMEALSAGLSFGYRMADVSEMKADKNGTGVSKGDVVKFNGSDPTKFEFSGFNIGVNVTMNY